ncbi:PREDICTED: uncharacterized protein LOC109329435 isoform X1 [Lupinus angustifolius]|uniref:uncharacterized protein LOC109329435 isoform X1 n=1 Tax=Lupinus angustifolius TaxID=3871 RepID=UPI00092ECBC8|nr:PREDICTED: uncharacterized protein LOC109329435 isoform X1 [Lupinus angustifolius]
MRTSTLTCLILTFIALNPSNAKQTQPISDILNIDDHLVLAGVLCFIASSISNAGGIGGGGLFIPTLTIIAGLDLKTASSFSAFMVTGGSLANVMYNMCTTSPKFGGKSLIDYNIALSSEPCMLLGVSVGVICNLVFPEWLITVLFALFLAWSTTKTCKSGILLWKIESEDMMRENGHEELENGLLENVTSEENSKLKIPWLKLWVLLLIWLSFFSINLLHGNKYGQSIIPMEPCGVGYWFLSSVQVPLAVVFTTWVVIRKESLQDQTLEHEVLDLTRNREPNKLVFPLVALLAGILGGVFGIGGGMLINPLLLHVGIAPEVTAATCSFMVFFSSTMSSFQYMLLGMEHIQIAIIFGMMCFVASLVGLLVVKRAIKKYGRTSLIVFSVSIVMSLSTVLMTTFGAIKVLRDYKSGRSMGFKLPC